MVLFVLYMVFGAIVLIPLLDKFKKNPFILFIAGFLIGGTFEYIISFLLEAFYGIRWWNYYQFPLNLNGRICFIYNIFWGLISVIVFEILKPLLDYLFVSIPKKLIKPFTYSLLSFLIIDSILTVIGMKTFIYRTVNAYSLNVHTDNNIIIKNEKINEFFSDEKIIKAFPNINIKDKNGKIIYLKQVVEES